MQRNAGNGTVQAIGDDAGEAVMVCDRDVPPAELVRLTSADARTLCLRVARTEGNRVVLAGDPD